MEAKVSSLFDDSTKTGNNSGDIQGKINAIGSIADLAEETEMETPKVMSKPAEVFSTTLAKENKPKDTSNKMWTLAVVGSVLILIASAVGMVFVLMQS